MTSKRKSARDLAAPIQAAMRATPDHLVVGENRTPEEIEAFLARVNAEHDGSVTSTISEEMRALLAQMATSPANVVAYHPLPDGRVELTLSDGSIVYARPDQDD
jgi:type IV secretory pathway ATPase VirB11/archaellum biosynthesis ATPase